MAGAAQGLTGADIAYVCQRAAMSCVKEAARGSSELNDIAIARHHFKASAFCARPKRARHLPPMPRRSENRTVV